MSEIACLHQVSFPTCPWLVGNRHFRVVLSRDYHCEVAHASLTNSGCERGIVLDVRESFSLAFLPTSLVDLRGEQ